MARTALIDEDLPPSLWQYAEAWAVKVLNILPTTANENCETPHSKMARLLGLHKDILCPFLQHIRVFGATAWLLLKGTQAPAKGDKTAPRAVKCRYLGAASRRGHVVYVWIPQKHQISTARDVTIVETFGDEKESLEEPEYIAQWESDDDSNDDLIKVKVKHSQTIEEKDNVDYITQIRIRDSEDEEEESAPFATPPMTPASTTTQVDCGQHTLLPTGEPSSSNYGEPEDADLQSFCN